MFWVGEKSKKKTPFSSGRICVDQNLGKGRGDWSTYWFKFWLEISFLCSLNICGLVDTYLIVTWEHRYPRNPGFWSEHHRLPAGPCLHNLSASFWLYTSIFPCSARENFWTRNSTIYKILVAMYGSDRLCWRLLFLTVITNSNGFALFYKSLGFFFFYIPIYHSFYSS